MANMFRCLTGFLFALAVTWTSGHPAHAQTNSSDRRQGSSALLDAIRRAELSQALASEKASKKFWADAPRAVTSFPMPSCVFPGGLCGALNRDGSVAVAPRYDWVDKFYEGRALVRQNGLYGYVDAAGQVIQEPKYESAGTYKGGLAEVSIDGMSALIDLDGRLVLGPRFARAHALTAEVFWVNDGWRRYQGRPGLAELIGHEPRSNTHDIDADGKWGLIARTGEWIRKPEFAAIRTFDHDDRSLTRVRAEAGWGVIKPDGTWQIEPKFETLSRLYNGLASARMGGKAGLVDRTGAFVIPAKFDSIGSFQGEGFITASIGSMWGLLDRTGAWVVEPQYELILHSPDKPIIWVRSGGKFGAIDRSGKWIVSPRFSQSGDMCDDGWVIGFDNRKRRAVPRDGMQLTLPDGDVSALSCKDPLLLEVNGKFGLVDRTLKPLTEVKFDSIGIFGFGAATANIDGKFGYLKPDGSWLIEPRFDEASNFFGEHAVAGQDKKFGCIRRDGSWEIGPQFQDKSVNCELVIKLGSPTSDAVNPGRTSRIDPRIQKIGVLAPGFYTAKLDGKFGVVNDAMDWVIEPRWQSYVMFLSLGLVAAKFEDKWGFIDATGALTIDDKYDRPSAFRRGIAWVQTGSSWCAIDRRGQRISMLPCQATNPSPDFQSGPVAITMRPRD